jgi:predicted Zn-dependent peptidase
VSNLAITRDVLDNGLRILTEQMSQVRSISIGVWLTRGSRHETGEQSGIAHFVEHMLFKGTATRSAEDIAQAIDSIGGQLDAFTAKEYASYYIKVLDEHLPLALDILSDIVLNPAFSPEDIEREKKVILEEIKMVEDAPDDLVHELFAQQFWAKHPLGRPILGTAETVSSFSSRGLRRYFETAYVASNLILVAAGHLKHAAIRRMVTKAFSGLPKEKTPQPTSPPGVMPGVVTRDKEIEQSHVCVGVPAFPQTHPDRHVLYVLNTVLGGSMSSRLFQHIREERGLAYAVFSNLATYSDAGMLTVYAGCATDKVSEVVALTLAELRGLRDTLVPADELKRAKDHLKGSLMLGLESTSSRMSHLARQILYFGKPFSLDATLDAIDAVTAADVRRIAGTLFRSDGLVATVVGPKSGLTVDPEQLKV